MALIAHPEGVSIYLKPVRAGFTCVESNSHLLWFCITTLSDWFKNLAPLSQPIMTRLCTFSRALRRLHVFASRFDRFTVFSVPFVIGQTHYFGFVISTVDRQSLYIVKDLFLRPFGVAVLEGRVGGGMLKN